MADAADDRLTPTGSRPAEGDGAGHFAAPTAAVPADGRMLRRGLRFAFDRLVRLVWAAVAVPSIAIVFVGALDRTAIAATLAVALLLWLPTTAVLFRATFLPSPPDPWLVDDHGRPLSARDLRATIRATAAEFALGVIPLLGVIPFLLRGLYVPTGVALGVGLALLLLVLFRDGRHVLSLWLDDVAIDLAAGEAARAARRLERMVRLPAFARSDAAWHLLARARFRTGEVAGALEALERIRDAAGWRVDLLRAQMGIAVLGAPEVRRAADTVRGDPELGFVAGLLDALADLHEGHPERVVAAADAILASAPSGETHRVAVLLVAAAWATREPERARALLREAAWDPRRVETLRRSWPGVGERLAGLGSW